MLSDRDALLAAIRANPEEDTPRLMFADWLEENGDATWKSLLAFRQVAEMPAFDW